MISSSERELIVPNCAIDGENIAYSNEKDVVVVGKGEEGKQNTLASLGYFRDNVPIGARRVWLIYSLLCHLYESSNDNSFISEFVALLMVIVT